MIRKFTPAIFLLCFLGFSLLSGQVCCSLQGYSPGTNIPGDADGRIDITLSQPWGTSLNFSSSGDIIRNPYIQKAYGHTLNFRIYHLSNVRFFQKISINSQISKIREFISESTYSTRFLSVRAAVSLFYISVSGRSSVWLTTGVPLTTMESNKKFPFEQWNKSSMELGVSLPLSSLDSKKNSYVSVIYYKLIKPAGLFELTHQIFSKVSMELWQVKGMIVSGGLTTDTGKLKDLQKGVYQTAFEPVNYGFMSSYIQLRIPLVNNQYMLNIKTDYPWLRWADNRLPAGFSDYPGWEISITAKLKYLG